MKWETNTIQRRVTETSNGDQKIENIRKAGRSYRVWEEKPTTKKRS